MWALSIAPELSPSFGTMLRDLSAARYSLPASACAGAAVVTIAAPIRPAAAIPTMGLTANHCAFMIFLSVADPLPATHR